MTVRFRCTTVIAAEPRAVFDLSLSIDVHTASMADSGETAVGGVTSGSISMDETVTWRARHFGVWWRMTSRVTVLDPPHRFVDEQVRGPFRHFRHVHTFVAQGSGTSMVDEVELSAPVPLLGRAVERAFLEQYVRGLILERNAYLKAAAEGA